MAARPLDFRYDDLRRFVRIYAPLHKVPIVHTTYHDVQKNCIERKLFDYALNEYGLNKWMVVNRI